MKRMSGRSKERADLSLGRGRLPDARCILLGLFLLAGWTGGVHFAGAAETYRFGVATPGGAWYPIGAVIGRLADKQYGHKVSLVIGGGAANAVNVGTGKWEFAITYSTTVYDASVGNPPFKEKLANLRVAGTLFRQVLLWTVWAGSDIRNYRDLKGKRVSVLPRAFSTQFLNVQVLSALGMSYKDFSRTVFLGLSDSVVQMKDGHIDAILVQGDAKYAPLVQLMVHKPIRFLSFTDEEIRRIRGIQPAVVPSLFSKGHYNQPGDVRTVSAYLLIVTHKDVSERLGYQMAKLLYGNVSELSSVNANLKTVNPKDAALDFGIPRHPGLTRYLKETGAP